MNKTIIYGSWISLAVAVGAGVLIAYGAAGVIEEASSRAQAAAEREQVMTRSAYDERLASIARETETERGRLDALISTDVVRIVEMIERVGSDAGAVVSVQNASAGGAAVAIPGGASLQPVVFFVEASGSYAKMMRVVSLLEQLPLASRLDDVSVERAGQGAGGWYLSARLRVYTTAPISI